jgi:hypothetical protein
LLNRYFRDKYFRAYKMLRDTAHARIQGRLA